VSTVTFYGGVKEVGGNKVLIRDGDTSIFLDFGMSFTSKRAYYSPPFLTPKSAESLIEFGILPKIKGVYKFERSEQSVDAVFLSHSHMDHSAYVTFLKRSIPIYCGETSKTILQTSAKTKIASLEFDIRGLKFQTFRTGDEIRLGSIRLKPIHVDHSVPGAYGFIVETSSGVIVYTGDFRMHGTKPEMTGDFIDKAREAESSIMVSECTNITNAGVSSEPEVMEKLGRIMKVTRGLIITDFSWSDVDRLRSFYNAAVKNGRSLVLTPKQAYLLKELAKDPKLKIPDLRDTSILVFDKGKKRPYRWEEEIFSMADTLDASKLTLRQKELVLVAPFYEFEELLTIKPGPGSCYIQSSSEPFNEEMEIDFGRLVNWLEHFGIPRYHIHVSGHIMPMDLREVISEIKPYAVFPIHGEHPEVFKKFISDLNCRVQIPQLGEEYRIGL